MYLKEVSYHRTQIRSDSLNPPLPRNLPYAVFSASFLATNWMLAETNAYSQVDCNSNARCYSSHHISHQSKISIPSKLCGGVAQGLKLVWFHYKLHCISRCCSLRLKCFDLNFGISHAAKTEATRSNAPFSLKTPNLYIHNVFAQTQNNLARAKNAVIKSHHKLPDQEYDINFSRPRPNLLILIKSSKLY